MRRSVTGAQGSVSSLSSKTAPNSLRQLSLLNAPFVSEESPPAANRKSSEASKIASPDPKSVPLVPDWTKPIGDAAATTVNNPLPSSGAHVLPEDIKEMTREQLQASFAELMAVNQAAIERDKDLTQRKCWYLGWREAG